MGVGYLINRTPSALLDYKTPYEVLFDNPPLLSICVYLVHCIMLITNGVKEISFLVGVEDVSL